MDEGARIQAYDPIQPELAKSLLSQDVLLCQSLEEALSNADCVFIITDWPEFKSMDLGKAAEKLKSPIFFDGRNCFSLEHAALQGVEYHSIGRESVGLK